MTIRLKLILAIGVPLLALLGCMLAFDYLRLRTMAYGETTRRMTEQAERYAAEFDGQFRTIAQVAKSLSSVLETDAEVHEGELYELLRRNVDADPLIYGSCVAFGPGVYVPPPGVGSVGMDRVPEWVFEKRRTNAALFCPYVFRGGPDRSLVRMDVADSYDYTDPKWDWWQIPNKTGEAFWTEPFFDEGAGNVVMVTYVSPIKRGGVVKGTVNVDVQLDELRKRALAGVPADTDLYIISRTGTFILAPLPEVIMRESIQSAAESYKEPEIAALGQNMLAGRRGTTTIRGMSDGEPLLVFYAPIPSAGWSLAGAVRESEVLKPVYLALSQRLVIGAVFIALVLGVVVLMGSWIVRPIQHLASAVKELSSGNLRAQVSGSRASDEVGELSRAFNGMVDKLNEQVAALTRETAARESVESELRLARTIQASLLPTVFPDRHDLTLHAVSSPARFVGGDFFDFFFAPDGKLTIVIADVSGKGVPAAMFMAVTRTLMREIMAEDSLPPGEALTRANRMLLEANPEFMFVTLFVARYDPKSGEIVYANAGHPPPLLMHRDSTSSPFGRVTGTVLGAVEGQSYTEGRATLRPGDTIVAFTDGVSEARAPDGKFFGISGISALSVELAAASTPKFFCEATLAKLEGFQEGNQHDDITLLVLRRNR